MELMEAKNTVDVKNKVWCVHINLYNPSLV